MPILNQKETDSALVAGARRTEGIPRLEAITNWVAAATALALAALYLGAFSATPRNADAVNGYLIGSDMGAGNLRLMNWCLPIDTFWLQDALAYALATRLFGDHQFFMIALPAVAWAAVVMTAWIVSRRGVGRENRAWSVLVIASLLALPVLRDNPLMVFISVGDDHVVTLLQALLAFWLADAFLRSSGAARIGLLVVLATALSAGDPMSIIFVTAPIAGAALLTNQDPFRRRLAVAGAAVFGALAGRELVMANSATGGFVIVQSSAVDFHFAPLEDLPRNVLYTAKALFSFASADVFSLPLRRAAPQLLHLPLLFLGAQATVAVAWQACQSALWLRPALLNFLDCVLVLGVVLVTAACLFSSVMVDFWCGRYMLPAVVLGAILVARRMPQLPSRNLFAAAGLIGSLLVLNAWTVGWRSDVRFAPNIADTTRWLVAHQLRFGYAQYWLAGPITAASHGDVAALAIVSDGERMSPYLWESRRDRYPAPLDARRPFFVIADPPGGRPESIDVNKSEAFFGPPSEREVIEGAVIDVYR